MATGAGPPRPLPYPLVMLVTDRAGGPASLQAKAGSAVAAGVTHLQLRDRTLEAADLLPLAQLLKRASSGTPCRILVNDRCDVAVAAAADGVHLPADAAPADRVRAVAPAGFLIGRSVHSVEEARHAEGGGGCDYLIFGTVFPSRNKPSGHPAAGVSKLAEVCAAVRLPVVAIGGITIERLPEVVRAGAAGIAGIDLFATETEQALIDRVQAIGAAFSAS